MWRYLSSGKAKPHAALGSLACRSGWSGFGSRVRMHYNRVRAIDLLEKRDEESGRFNSCTLPYNFDDCPEAAMVPEPASPGIQQVGESADCGFVVRGLQNPAWSFRD